MLQITQRCGQVVSKFQQSLINSSKLNKRYIRCSSKCDDKNINRQIKILGKLYGNRVTGTKRKWYPSGVQSNTSCLPTVAGISNSKNKDGKNASRRVVVLNKLFMNSITDLLATGEISMDIIGKGLEISKVKVASDFQTINVYWIAKGDTNDDELENILQSCSGIIRHELSQLRLMGEVPRIRFVKDKTFANIAKVELLLKKFNFRNDEQNILTNNIHNDLNLELFDDVNQKIPEMRHDVLGLDHQKIMLKILTKLKKSKQAWETYEQGFSIKETVSILGDDGKLKLDKKNEESVSDRFDKFISKRKRNGFVLNTMSKYSDDDNFEFLNPQSAEDSYYDGIDDGDYMDDNEKTTKKI